ncbi:MAG: ABC transporter substrate-binding protein [Alphaproteobacteria bacterium]
MLAMKRAPRLPATLAAIAALAVAVPAGGARADGTLEIAMTASDVPTTTGMPNNGYEGMRFLGYPVFEGLVLWDLDSADELADIRPGLAESWEQSTDDPTRWVFDLRDGVTFHDGSAFDADAVIWNLERYYDPDSTQFDPEGSAIIQARNPNVESWEKIDDDTVAITSDEPLSYFPYLLVYMLFSSPAQFEAVGSDWAAFAEDPSGTGPFTITDVRSRESVTLARNEAYWDDERVPELDRMILYPMPEATTRLAALRSGQVDWIEVPPPDAVPSIEAAGFEIVTNSYPHVWPWVFNLAAEGSPFRDVRVRQAANYCVDREGMVELLNGLAEPSYGFFKRSNPNFGEPEHAYAYDPERARELLAASGYGEGETIPATVMISTSGSGQMVPVPMNEYLQQTLAECGFDISFEVVEWGTVLVAVRNDPTGPQARGAHALNMSLVSSDISQMARWFWSGNFAPTGSNWGQWKNEEFDGLLAEIQSASDPAVIERNTTRMNEILVDEAPWLWVVHDLNPRAMSPDVEGFVSAQSWFQDFTSVTVAE